MPETTPPLTAEHEDAFCANCLSLMVEDHGAGHLCPVCDEHDDCDDFPCSGFDGDACVLNQPLIIHPLKGPPIPAGGHAPDDATPPSSGREAPTAPPADPTPTLTAEQRERIAEALHAAETGGAPCWPDCHEEEWYRDQAEALAPRIARMVADAEQRGRAEVSAAVEAVLGEATPLQGGDLDGMVLVEPDQLRAVLTDPAAAVARIKAEAWDEGYTAADFAVHRGVANPCAVLDRGNPYRADRIGGAPDA